MPRLSRPSRRSDRLAGQQDRPSRLLIFARRQRRMIRPVLLGAVLLGIGGLGLHVSHAMRTEAQFAPMRAEIGRTAGLRVTDIKVDGRNMTPESQVMTALGVSKGDPLLGFSVEAARRRLDQLSFVEHATVERRLPGTVLVQLTERRPYAVWQNQGRFLLIDRRGQVVATTPGKGGVMNGKDAEAFATLPLVVGAGAPADAASLIDDLAAEPVVRKQVVASVRVGRRRWNLSLRSGAEVLLPEGEEVPALRRLALLENSMHLLERPLTDIDLRLPDRLMLRPRPQPATDAADPTGGAPAAHPGSNGQSGSGGDSSATRRPA